jgi:hypothetical protein
MWQELTQSASNETLVTHRADGLSLTTTLMSPQSTQTLCYRHEAPDTTYSIADQPSIHSLDLRHFDANHSLSQLQHHIINRIATLKMCQTELFKSATCAHKWMTIVRPCTNTTSFSSSKYHTYKPVRKGPFAPKYITAPANSCPSCDKKGDYDSDMIRFVLRDGNGRRAHVQGGNLGNGYDLTDGYGNVIQPQYAYGGMGYGAAYGLGYGYGGYPGVALMPPGTMISGCGVSRTSMPQQYYQYSYGHGRGCCSVM